MLARLLITIFLLSTLFVTESVADSYTIMPKGSLNRGADLEVFNYSILSAEKGLSSNMVQCLAKDDDGMMWFGTNDGLCRYDGYGFTTYLPERGNTEAILGKNIKGINKISNRYLQISLSDGGLSTYDKLNNIFLNGKDENGIDFPNANEFEAVYGVTEIGDYSYIAYTDHISKRNKNTGEYLELHIPGAFRYSGNTTMPTRIKRLPLNDKHIVLQLGRSAIGVARTDMSYMRVIRFGKASKIDAINDICPIDSSNIMLATSQGLYVYNLHSRKLRKQEIDGVGSVQSVEVDDAGVYWIAHDDAELMKWVPKEKYYRVISNTSDFFNKQTIVRDMYLDDNGLLWVATINSGVIKLDTKNPKIRTHLIKTDLPENYHTYNFHGLSRNEIYASCGEYGVLRIDVHSRTSKLFPIPDKSVYSVYQRKNKDLVVGTGDDARIYTKGFERLEKIISFPQEIIDTMHISRILTKEICEDCLGNIWLATNLGLFRYNGFVCEPQVYDGIWGESIECVYEDKDGWIWCGNHIGSFVKQSDESGFVQTDAYETNHAPNNHTYCFCEYDNQVLIGTASGVLSYDKKTDHVSTASFNQSFDNTIVYSIATDGEEALWVSTNTGVGYIEGTSRVYRFDHYDGLEYLGNECRRFAVVEDYIYFGNATSVSSMNLHRVRLNDKIPNTYVSKLLYGQSGEEAVAYMNADSVYVVKFLVKAGLRIQLGSSDMSIPSRNEYKYRIDKDEWIYLGTNNEIILSGLIPGLYDVEARSSNGDKQMSDTSLQFKLNVVPPMWASTAALAFYFFMLLVIFWLLLNMRFRSVNRRMRHMAEEMRGKKAIEDQRNRLAKIHKDQTDSISYAKHIQEGIMPKADSVVHLFKKLFVLYKPKDIVSGDYCCFYHRDDMTFIVAADCTGHGVPGAFISILGMDHLFNIIMKQKENDAGKILTYLHQETYSTVFKHSTAHQNFNEGMDMTICVVHHKESYLEFAGAMNDLYMIRDNEISTYKGDRFTIGTNTSMDAGKETLPTYRTHRVDYRRGDMFYMFSDGYVDQFGGPEQKKFKHRRFKHLLLNIHKMPARDQKIILYQRLEDWRGVNEQTDDISIVGFEPWNKDGNR